MCPGLGLLSLMSCLLGLRMSNWIPREQEGWGQLCLGHGKNEGEIKKGLCALSGCLYIWQGWRWMAPGDSPLILLLPLAFLPKP